MITTVLLDLDDTLMEDDQTVLSCLFGVCASRVPRVPPEQLVRAVWHQMHSLWREAGLEPVGERLGVLPIAAMLVDLEAAPLRQPLSERYGNFAAFVWTEALRSVGAPEPALGGALAAAFRRTRLDRVCLAPGVLAALRWLAGRYRLGLVTNGASALQRAKLERLGVGELFQAVCISEECGAGKPDPQLFEHALRALGASPGEALMVGDDVSKDVCAAAALGLSVLWVGTGGGESQLPAGALRAASVADLPQLLDAGAGGGARA